MSPSPSDWKVVVVGTGGIGGVVAANLTRAGVDVTPVVGNPRIGEAIDRQGYRVRELDGHEWSVPAARRALTTLGQEDGPFDLALVVTQNPALEAALKSLSPCLMPEAPVVTFQNGLPEDRARRLVGDRVLGCVVGWGASMVEPGLYQRTSKGSFTLGRPSAAAPDPAPVARLLEPAAPAVVTDDLQGVRWSKLAINCVTSTLGACGGERLGKLLSYRVNRRLALEIFAEVAEVARASGVKVQPVGGTLDIDKIAISEAERDLAIGSPALAWKHSVLLAVGWKFRRMRSSMLYALEKGRPPEIDFLNGEIVRRGAQLGVPTPVCAALVDRVRAIAGGRAKPSLAGLAEIYDSVVARRPKRSLAA
jgi:2-dehydropantoate 2-reductase